MSNFEKLGYPPPQTGHATLNEFLDTPLVQTPLEIMLFLRFGINLIKVANFSFCFILEY